ncbi:MAG: hypothetical protein ACKVQU_25915 [Burkholderiales bacterium]
MTVKNIIPILGLAHIVIRVQKLDRSVRCYVLLGSTKTAVPTSLTQGPRSQERASC